MTAHALPPVSPAPSLPFMATFGWPLLAAAIAASCAFWRSEQGCVATAMALLAAGGVYLFFRLKSYRRQFAAQTALLAENERSFLQALDGASHGMALVSEEGKWLRANKTVSRITGYSQDELLKLDFQTITHPDDLDADLHYVQQVLERKIETYSMEKRYIRKDGSIVWILLTVSAMWDPAGNFRYFISEIQDINERKLLQEKLRVSEARLRGQ